MSTAVQRRRGTTAQHASFAGLNGELTVDTDKEVVVVHDGTTAGGYPQMRENGSNSALALGSAGTPSLKFAGDTNTGIYSPGADQLALSTNGTGRLFVDASGNVGVGISPLYALHVSSSSTSSAVFKNPGAANAQIFVGNTAGDTTIRTLSTGDGLLFSDTGKYLAFGTNGAVERLRITSAGLVGVGTSSPGSYDFDGPTMLAAANTAGSSTVAIVSDAASLGQIAFADGTSSTARYRGLLRYNHLTDGLEIRTAATPAITIDSSQRVGIGTSVPTHNLTIGNTLPADYVLALRGGVGGFLGWDDSANCTILQAPNTRSLQFRVNSDTFSAGTMAMHINSSGQVGIGTTSPAELLHVNGGNQNIRLSGSYSPSQSNKIEINNGETGGTRYATGMELESDSSGNYFSSFYVSAASNTRSKLLAGNASSTVLYASNTERARIDSSGRILIGTSSARTNFGQTGGNTSALQIEGTAFGTSRITITRNSADGGRPDLTFAKTRSASVGGNTAVVSGDFLGQIAFAGSDGTNFPEAATIVAQVDNGADGTALTGSEMPGRLVFSTTADGASSPTERMRIDSRGFIYPDISSSQQAASYQTVEGSGFRVISSTSILAARFEACAASTDTRYAAVFSNPNGIVGSISTNSSATSYTTSSDYRLKENVAAVSDGITRLQQLKPSRFNFIADPAKTVDGFIAHEVQTVVPEAITGEKDAVDAKGNPIYQGIDQSKLVPLLTAALQEAVAKIESLEARLTAAGL